MLTLRRLIERISTNSRVKKMLGLSKFKLFSLMLIAAALVATFVALVVDLLMLEGSDLPPVRLAVVAPMSGEAAAIGRAVREGVELEAERINREGGIDGRRISVLSFDDGNDPRKARAAAEAKAKAIEAIAEAEAKAKAEAQAKAQAEAEAEAEAVAKAETSEIVGIGKGDELVPITQARGKLPFPASGHVVIRYGQATETGMTQKGISIKTRDGARVVAPYDGLVVFAGQFRGYGQILILEHGEGYHTLLAGLTR
ncbi:MAG: ABC transporter substrate-binding protein, partial [Gemmatimonadetes bacterium]|nr:ABC transporter substrate-binding protein [Gemmatimonadota bacterium]